jgi:hypothetical protein
MILVDRGQKVRFLNFRDFGIFFFFFLRMTSYLKMTINLADMSQNLFQNKVMKYYVTTYLGLLVLNLD